MWNDFGAICELYMIICLMLRTPHEVTCGRLYFIVKLQSEYVQLSTDECS